MTFISNIFDNKSCKFSHLRRCLWVAGFFTSATLTYAEPSLNSVSQYRVVSRAVVDRTQRLLLTLREFKQDHEDRYLLVDPTTLDTSIRAVASVMDRPDLMPEVAASPYARALARTTSQPWPLQNQGLKQAVKSRKDVAYLTIDMCPSSRAFNKSFYERLIAYSKTQALPITIDISGMWMMRHRPSFEWLKAAADSKQLHVTWVNHAYQHRYDPSAPLHNNFLLMPNTDFDAETLNVEKLLIANGETPSIFIRYPGLVSDKQIVMRTRQLGLIPLGANAWLAKGEHIQDGSIVLVHANGNEPLGLTLLPDSVLLAHHWHRINEAATDTDHF